MPKINFSQWKTWEKIAGIIGGITGFMTIMGATLAFAGVQLPTNAWQDDVLEAEERVVQQIKEVKDKNAIFDNLTKQKLLEQRLHVKTLEEKYQERELEKLEKRERELKIEALKLKRENEGELPDFFVQEQLEVEDDIEKEKEALREIKSEKIQIEIEQKKVQDELILPIPQPTLVIPTE